MSPWGTFTASLNKNKSLPNPQTRQGLFLVLGVLRWSLHRGGPTSQSKLSTGTEQEASPPLEGGPSILGVDWLL